MDVRPLTEAELADRLAEAARLAEEFNRAERARQERLLRCNCPDFCVYHMRIGPC